MWQFWKSCNLILHPPWVCFDVCYYFITILSQEILSLTPSLTVFFSFSASVPLWDPWEPRTLNMPDKCSVSPAPEPSFFVLHVHWSLCTVSQLGGMLMTGTHRSPGLGCWPCMNIGARHWQYLDTGCFTLAFTSSILGICIKMQSLFKKPWGNLKQTNKQTKLYYTSHPFYRCRNWNL